MIVLAYMLLTQIKETVYPSLYSFYRSSCACLIEGDNAHELSTGMSTRADLQQVFVLYQMLDKSVPDWMQANESFKDWQTSTRIQLG